MFDIELSDNVISGLSTMMRTIKIIKKDSVIYENMKMEEGTGYLYTVTNLNLNVETPDITDNKIQIASNAIVYLDSSIKNRIVFCAGKIQHYEEGHRFVNIADTREADLAEIEDPVSKNSVYFYRGSVENNYVYYANQLWRILRINANGSLRLILDGTIGSEAYQDSNGPKGTSANIESAIKLLSWKDSKVYTKLQEWYTNNIKNKTAEKYIVETEYVFDTAYEQTTSSSTSGSVYYFAPYLRCGIDGNAYTPTFSYTNDSLIKDNIGLITADEILYAGGYWKIDNTNYFLHNPSITGAYWTMSPSFFDNSAHHKAGMVLQGVKGQIYDWPNDETGDTLKEKCEIRPVISIRGDIYMSGDGTKESPFTY